MFLEGLMPHGACWRWNAWLILLHAPADLGTFTAYARIAAVAFFIYRAGHLIGIDEAYPKLWRLGWGFVGLCGVSHLGNFLEVWFGGGLYYLTGANKIAMAIVSLRFASEFGRRRSEMVLFARAFALVQEEQRKLLATPPPGATL